MNFEKEFEKIVSAIESGKLPYDRAYLDISDDLAKAIFDEYDPADIYLNLPKKEWSSAYRLLSGIGANVTSFQLEWMKKAIWYVCKKHAWDDLEPLSSFEDDELDESIITEPDGSRSVLIPYHGERCHAKIVTEIPTDARYDYTHWRSMGYDIYMKYSAFFDPWETFIAIKPENVKETKTVKTIERILNGENIRSVLCEAAGSSEGFIYEVQPGDFIRALGDKAVVKDILFQDVYIVLDPNSHIKSHADVEFKDENDKYRHWQSWSDGGTLITNDGSTYKFEKES